MQRAGGTSTELKIEKLHKIIYFLAQFILFISGFVLIFYFTFILIYFHSVIYLFLLPAA